MICKAIPTQLDAVRRITQETIDAVYPRYYPAGAVAFFKAHHSDAAISADIAAGNVYLFWAEGEPVGTVTVRANEIARLFVLPAHQRRGCGKQLLDFAESLIAADYREVVIDSSLPAKPVYLKRGYAETEYHIIPTDEGHFLCYDVMRKTLP